MKVVAFNASPRPNGNTSILLQTALEPLAAAGIETEVVQFGRELLRGCSACYGCFKKKDGHCTQTDDALNGYIDRIVAADGVLLGSPTYFADVPAPMKALIDRAGMVARANGNLFRRKVGAAVIAVRRAGAIHAFDTINHFFLIGEWIVAGSSYWNIGVGREAGEVNGDAEGLATMRTLGENMAWLLGKLSR